MDIVPAMGAAPPAARLCAGAGTPSEAPHFTITLTDRIEDVAPAWHRLEAQGVDSPAQTLAFIRLWIAERRIAPADQLYVLAEEAGEPVALMALHRRRRWGFRILTWFSGAQVGSHGPLIDRRRLAALGPAGRRALWRQMLGRIGGADLVYLRAIPEGAEGLFAELGRSVVADTLYRAAFESWAECDATQRSRTRRKHDRQQGERLAALGAVSFETVRNGGDAREALDTMFRQRSARFRQMGVRDTFTREGLTGFYHAMMRAGSGVEAVLHVLRLDGEIVATRFNVAAGEKMFCLISSMSDDAAIRAGSPGKQCLLRVMQSVFDEGYRVFDMGAGFTDEKRHWCNRHTPLRQHYVPLTLRGRLLALLHEAAQRLRARIKADRRLVGHLRALDQMLRRG